MTQRASSVDTALTPAVLAAYLAVRGWIRSSQVVGRHESWTGPSDSSSPEEGCILLPTNSDLRDYPRRLQEAVWGVEESFTLTSGELVEAIAAMHIAATAPSLPPYPRTPHLWPDDAHPRRLVVPSGEVAEWLRSPVVVEEKIDGANVSLWWSGSTAAAASRGGADAMDRAGQLGRLRAWAAERLPELEVLLDGGWVLYGEWLWVRHGVAYDALTDWLVALDLWHADHGFAVLDERDERCTAAGLALPPRLFTGVLGERRVLAGLVDMSRLAVDAAAEGLILRRDDGQRCKVVRPGFTRRDDAAWSGTQEHNRLDADRWS